MAIKQYQKYIPKLVLMDVNMPIMNGINAFFKIKLKYDNANIVLISGNPINKEIQNAINFRLTDYLEKPVSPQLLKQLLKHHTSDKSQIMRSEKEYLVIAIEYVLLEMGILELNKVRNMLQNNFNCDLDDCLTNPQYLKSVLCELFGQNYAYILQYL